MKKRLMSSVVYALIAVSVAAITGCNESLKQSASGATYYTKYNFHYTTEKGEVRGSVANWTKVPEHRVLPYGSPVKVKPWKSGYSLIDPKSGKTINVLSKSKFLNGKSLSEYLDLILSTTPVSYGGLSEVDRKGISEGRPYEGMTKKGVMIALGYPCPHDTPSPDFDTWKYWANRFGNYYVTFKDGVVVSSGY
ncbi:MAG: hypothetical protein ABFR90_02445 [Planctomycetota bacterium]